MTARVWKTAKIKLVPQCLCRYGDIRLATGGILMRTWSGRYAVCFPGTKPVPIEPSGIVAFLNANRPWRKIRQKKAK